MVKSFHFEVFIKCIVFFSIVITPVLIGRKVKNVLEILALLQKVGVIFSR